MQSAKETAANTAASAKAGMEKTKATLQEKGEKMTTRDPLKKDMAEERKQERIHQAELQKQGAREQAAAAATDRSGMGQGFTTGGDRSTGCTAEGEVPLDCTRTDETGRVLPQDPNVGGGARTGHGMGGTY